MISHTANQIEGMVTNIQHFSVDDGPGIRTTVFLKGCPLRCAWCHNPETQKLDYEIMYREDKCHLCGACMIACAEDLHKLDKETHFYERLECKVCGACSRACVFGALERVGQKMTVSEVISEILIDSHFCKISGGGVTVSGGEPLAQPKFTEELLMECKNNSLHTCVETCGYSDTESILKINKYTDLFLFDYKLTDEELHKKYTGVSREVILNNLTAICQADAKIILRCPMIPEVNINKNHFDGIIALANKCKNIIEINLEPYHPLGVSKSVHLGKEAAYDRKEFLEKEELIYAQSYIQEKVNIPVKIL